MRIISGEFRGRALKTVAGPGYRPATGRVREAIFSMLEARGIVWPERSVLDLFAGSGSLAFEAASRGARRVCLVEFAADAARCLVQSARALGLSPLQCSILQEDVLRLLARPKAQAGEGESYDVVFMDPPYGQKLVPSALELLMRGKWLSENGFLLAEVEDSACVDENAHEELECLIHRRYGQTHILLWQRCG